ncbi:MAG: cell division protein FtsL [Verrucomicrobiota bacterium]
MNGQIVVLIIVLVLNVASALGVVYARHESRNLSTLLGALESDRDQAVAEWSRLQLEQAWRANAGQIEARAENELGMRPPAETHILVIGQ